MCYVLIDLIISTYLYCLFKAKNMKLYIYNISLFLFLFLFSISILLAQETSEAQAEWESSVTKLEKTFSVLEDEYIEDLDFKKATENAIKGLLKELDPHSSYCLLYTSPSPRDA